LGHIINHYFFIIEDPIRLQLRKYLCHKREVNELVVRNVGIIFIFLQD
jgi:hypothetical protein